MKLSKKCEYAIKALVELAIAYDKKEATVLIHEIAKKDKIPPRYLEQILLTLKKAGLLLSKRGVGGGYSLRRAPETISFAEIISVVDGTFSPDETFNNILKDDVSSTLDNVIHKVQHAAKTVAESISLKDMAKITLKKMEQRQGILNYVI